MAITRIITSGISDTAISTAKIADDAVDNTKLDLSQTYNFTSMPQKGGNDIVTNGSNSNGSYFKFADGTMICTAAFTVQQQNNGPSAGNFYYSNAGTWTYPVAFSSGPRVIAQVYGGHYNAVSAKTVSVGTTSTTYLTMSINSTTNAQSLLLFAIGVWS